MNAVIGSVNPILQPIIDLSTPVVIFFVLMGLSLIAGAKFLKAFESGLKLAVALIGIGLVINSLVANFNPHLLDLYTSTGINVQTIDVGWAPLAIITWGSLYTLFFLFILVMVNIVMLYTNKTNTLDVDIFNTWHVSIIGLIVLYYSNNLIVATLVVVFIGVLKFINSDLIKPTFHYLLDTPETTPTTTTHMNFLLNPFVMLLDELVSKLFPAIDKYDFDAAALNNKVGFLGSKFAIGAFTGAIIGIMSGQTFNMIFVLAFIGAASLELFSIVGSWFTSSLEPLSQGITTLLNNRLNGRQVNIGIDWPFIGARAELWAVANVLAPIMVVMAIILPGSHVLPMGGVIAIGLTPALLVVCKGRIMRMLIVGILTLPVFLWSGSAIAPFVTHSSQSIGVMDYGFGQQAMITHATLEGPIEKFIGILVGQAANSFDLMPIIYAVVALAAYCTLFYWYVIQMKKRNREFQAQKTDNQ